MNWKLIVLTVAGVVVGAFPAWRPVAYLTDALRKRRWPCAMPRC